METNYIQATKYAEHQIQATIDRNVTPIVDSITRSQILGVYSDSFDWRGTLDKSTTDYDEFDSLKRYCAQQIRKEVQLPEDLKLWVTGYLDEFVKPPKRARGQRPKMGREMNMFLPQLVHRISIDFGLTPTRNRESKQRLSGCDAVSEAINSNSVARRIFSTKSYDSLVKAYGEAKKRDALVR